MAGAYLFLAFPLLLVVNGQLPVDEEPTVILLPSDEILVRKGQDLSLSCQIKGPAVTDCSWQLDGAPRIINSTIENRLLTTGHYGKCRIAMKVTLQDIGQWTCNIFTDARPKSATTRVSLVQDKPRTIAGLVTIVFIGFVILVTYLISFSLLKICRFEKARSFKGNDKGWAPRQKLASALSRSSSRESSDQFEVDVAMTTNPTDGHWKIAGRLAE